MDDIISLIVKNGYNYNLIKSNKNFITFTDYNNTIHVGINKIAKEYDVIIARKEYDYMAIRYRCKDIINFLKEKVFEVK